MKVRCSVCDKIVDHIEISYRHQKGGQYRITALCHGDRDEMVLTMNDLWGMGPYATDQIMGQEGIAFVHRGITQGADDGGV